MERLCRAQPRHLARIVEQLDYNCTRDVSAALDMTGYFLNNVLNSPRFELS